MFAEKGRHRAARVPLGVGEEFTEGVVTLQPGDTLVVHSDGLVEGEDSVDLQDFAADLEKEVDAARMVHRLTFRISGRMADDVTVVVLRREVETADTAALEVAGAAVAVS